MNAVIVDTSVWIDFFGGRSCDRLEEALEIGSIVTPPLVVSELLSGVKSKDRESIVELLSDLELAATPLAHWIAVGDLRRELQRRGLTVSTPDAHVAQCALERDALLLSQDAVFAKIAAFLPLRLSKG